MLAWLREKWRLHGTKILGVLTAIVGALNAASVEIGTLLSERERHIFTALLVALGYLTVQRGFANSKTN